MINNINDFISKIIKTEKISVEDFVNKIIKSDVKFTKEKILELKKKYTFDYKCGKKNIIDHHLDSYSFENRVHDSVKKLMTDIGKHFHPKTILDPACGIGTLISDFSKNYKIDAYEIDKNIAKLAQYLSNKKIVNENFINQAINNKYDLIITQGMAFDVDINRNSSKNKIFFLNKCLDLLNENGFMIFIIPKSFLTSDECKKIRINILRKYSLEMVISLTKNLSFFYDGYSIVIIRNVYDQKDKVLFIEFNGNNNNEIIDSYENENGKYWIDSIKLYSNQWDINFFMPNQYTKKISEIAEIIYGLDRSSISMIETKEKNQDYRVFTFNNENIKFYSTFGFNKSYGFYDSFVFQDMEGNIILDIDNNNIKPFILKKNDIIINLTSKAFTYYIYKNEDPKSLFLNNVIVLRTTDNNYLLSYLSTNIGYNYMCEKFKKIHETANYSRQQLINIITEIEIPTLPIIPNDVIDSIIYKIRTINSELTTNNYDSTKAKIEPLVDNLATEIKNINKDINNKESLVSFELIQCLMDNYHIFLKKIDSIKENYLSNQMAELKNLILLSAAEIKSDTNQIIDITEKSYGLLKDIKDKINNELIPAFAVIKSSQRDEEYIINKINHKIDSTIGKFIDEKNTDIEHYETKIKQLYHYYSLLDQNSLKFLFSAEFLFDEMSKIHDIDFSPIILQYCRTLENEILKKLFELYHLDIYIRYSKEDIEKIINNDVDYVKKNLSKYNVDEYIKNVNNFHNNLKKNKTKYELGTMQYILSLLKDNGETLNHSTLLRDFKEYTLRYFKEKLIQKEYLMKIKLVTEEFRNKAAHPYVLNIDILNKSKEIIKEALDSFFEYYHNVT